jgi:hypothetical protein
MRFSLCFCLKRHRAAYSVSSTNVSYKKSNPTAAIVTLPPLSLSSGMPHIPVESDYEKIIGSSGDGEICTVNDHRHSTISAEYGGYTELKSIPPPRQPFIDDTQLYATVDKTKMINNRIRMIPNATASNSATLQQGSSPASATTFSFSPNSHLIGSSPTSLGATPPPLPPPLLPPQVYTSTTVNTTTNNNDDNSSRRPYYDEVIIRESLQHRAQRLQREEEQNQLEQQLHENYYSSVNSEQGTTTSNDLYAEIANGSGSGTVHQNYQFYSRPLDSDDLSERYATVIEINNNGDQPTTRNSVYQEIESLRF